MNHNNIRIFFEGREFVGSPEEILKQVMNANPIRSFGSLSEWKADIEERLHLQSKNISLEDPKEFLQFLQACGVIQYAEADHKL